MPKNSFILDKTGRADNEKILYHLLSEYLWKYFKKRRLYIGLFVIGLLLLIFSLTQFSNEDTAFAVLLLVMGAGTMSVTGYLYYINKIPLKIKRFGLAYLPVSLLGFQKGSILVDRFGLLKPVKFEFTNLMTGDILKVNDAFNKLKDQTEKIPPVLSGGKTHLVSTMDETFQKEDVKIYEEEANFIELTGDLQHLIEKTEDHVVDIRAFHANEKFLETLNKKYSTKKPFHMYEELTEEDIQSKLHEIDGIIDLYQADRSNTSFVDIDDLCIQILDLLERSVPRMDYSVFTSLNQIIVPETYRFTDIIEKASYNYYCPNCNEELINRLETSDYSHNGSSDHRVFFPENTRMIMSDLFNNTWQCPLCRQTTNSPFPKHKMEDELFTVVYDKLYEENYIERLKIYNNINDQKRDYSEKSETQSHQVLRESRTKVDQIKSTIRAVETDILSDESAIVSLNTLLQKYKRIAEDKAQQIAADVKHCREVVAAENKKSKERIDAAVNNAKASIAESTRKYATLERIDQRRRDEVQKNIAARLKKIERNTR